MKIIRGLVASIAAFILVGCSGSPFEIPKSSSTPTNSECLDIFVQAYATGVSKGAYDCLSSDLQFQFFAGSGLKDESKMGDYLRQRKGIIGQFDVSSWDKPIPASYWKENTKFKPTNGDVSRAYYLYPQEESDSIGYYSDGFSLILTVDKNGKVVDIE